MISIFLTRAYVVAENQYCEKELEAFYDCKEPSGSPIKECLRQRLSSAKDEFTKAWSQLRDA